jgi:hypothetical protein
MNEQKNNRLYYLILLAIILWFGSWFFIDYLYSDVSDRGSFGDKFGFINSLFSGLALAGIIYSIFLQQKELSLQRTELKETKEEFRDQNFQTTFFNLLKTQNQLADDISATIGDLKSFDKEEYREIIGRKFFNQSKFQLQRIDKALNKEIFTNYSKWSEEDHYNYGPSSSWEADDLTRSMRESFSLKFYRIDKETWESSKNLSPLERAERLYAIFFNKYYFVIGHYYRHFYHILLFLEETEKEKILKANDEDEKNAILKEFNQFAEFVQAQMSTPELFLLFYNALSFPKLQRLLIKYNTLENLPIEDLINPEHNGINGVNLKSRIELLR